MCLRDCLKFAFMNVIQSDLERMKDTWNNHRIRANKIHANGIPDYLYYLPEHRGKIQLVLPAIFCYLLWLFVGLEDYSCICEDADLNLCRQYACEKPEPTSVEFKRLAEILIQEENLTIPSSAEEALSLYFELLRLLSL